MSLCGIIFALLLQSRGIRPWFDFRGVAAAKRRQQWVFTVSLKSCFNLTWFAWAVETNHKDALWFCGLFQPHVKILHKQLISEMCGLFKDHHLYQVQGLIQKTPKLKAAVFAASADEPDSQTEVYDSSMFSLTAQHIAHTDQRLHMSTRQKACSEI